MEVLIVASITLLFMTIVMVSGGVLLRHMSVSMGSYEWFHRFYGMRMASLASDEDTTIIVMKDHVTVQYLGKNKDIFLPSGMTFSGAATLGFKGNGDTKYAGTLVLSQSGSSSSLSMPVGYGHVVVQDATRF